MRVNFFFTSRVVATFALVFVVLVSANCFPYFHRNSFPQVGEEIASDISAERPDGNFLLLTIWHQETYRWSEEDITRPCILASPQLASRKRLAMFHQEAERYWDYGVQAFDQHAGTRVRMREPFAMFIIADDGAVAWLTPADLAAVSTWRIEALSRIGVRWKRHLLQQVALCSVLTRDGTECLLDNSIFADAVSESCDIRVDYSSPSRSRLLEFVDRIPIPTPSTDLTESWQRTLER